MKLDCCDPEYHHLNGPPLVVHTEVEFGESMPEPISATSSSF